MKIAATIGDLGSISDTIAKEYSNGVVNGFTEEPSPWYNQSSNICGTYFTMTGTTHMYPT